MKAENEAVLRDFLQIWKFQFFKKICETFSNFGRGELENKAFLRDILQTWQSKA
jgi:hypothetical protein